MEQETTRDELLDKPLPLYFLAVIPIWAGGILAILLFPFAGDWQWLEGWAYILAFVLTMTICTGIINKKNPRVLRNRMKVKKEGLTDTTKASAGSDWFIMPVMSVGFFGALILPGLDYRWGWSSMPVALKLVGLVLTNAGLVVMNVAMLQNSYASKLLDINKVLLSTIENVPLWEQNAQAGCCGFKSHHGNRSLRIRGQLPEIAGSCPVLIREESDSIVSTILHSATPKDRA